MSSPYDEIDFDYATTIADRANRLMSQHGVPPTPDNFSVWFYYAIGGSLTLKKTIDVLIANKRKFDSVVNRDLYVTYVKPYSDPGLAEDFPEQVHAVIASAQEFLATAISDNTVFSQVGIHTGVRRIARLAQQMGIRTHVSHNYAMILGAPKIGPSVLDMAHAY